jgi:hypothetical protein
LLLVVRSLVARDLSCATASPAMLRGRLQLPQGTSARRQAEPKRASSQARCQLGRYPIDIPVLRPAVGRLRHSRQQPGKAPSPANNPR